MKDEIKIDNNSAEITNDNSYIDDINIDNKILIVEEKGKPLSKYKNGDKVFWANYSVDKNWKQYVEGEVFIKNDEYSIKRFSQNPNFKKYPLATFNSNTKVALKPQNEPIYADKTIKNADLIKKKIKVMEQESKVENNSADLIDKKIRGLKIALKVAIKEEKELIKKRIKAFEIAKKMSIPKVSVAGDFGYYNDYSQKEKDAIEKKYGTQSKQYKVTTLPKSFDWKNADVIGVQTPTELEENGDDWLDEQGIDKKKFGVTLNSNYGQNSKMLDNLIGLDDESYYVVLYLYEKGTDNLPKSFDWKNAEVINMTNRNDLEEQGINTKKYWVTTNPKGYINQTMLDNVMVIDEDGNYNVLYLYEKGSKQNPLQFADGLRKNQLVLFKNKYFENEDNNKHSENVLLLAQNFGTQSDINNAVQIVKQHEKDGQITSENRKKRMELDKSLMDKAIKIMSENKIMFFKNIPSAKVKNEVISSKLNKGELFLFKNKYFENESNNRHSENVLLLAQNFGTQKDIDNAVEIVKDHEKDGHLTTENYEKRTKLEKSLMVKAKKIMAENNFQFAKGGGVSSWNTLTIEKIGKNFPYKLNALNEILQNAGGKRNGKIYDFSLDRQSNKYDTFAQFVYSASIILNDTGSDSVTPSGTYFSQKSLPIRFYLRYTIRKDGNNNPITINASKDVAGGMSIYKSMEVNSLYDIEKYINSIIRDNPPNNLENMVYKKGGYTRPSNKINTTGFFLFKTKDNEYIVRSSFFERQNDIEDSLEIQDKLREKLGSIIISNSAWKRLSDGNTIKARSNKGNLTGTLTRLSNLEDIYDLYKPHLAKGGKIEDAELYVVVYEINGKKQESEYLLYPNERVEKKLPSIAKILSINKKMAKGGILENAQTSFTIHNDYIGNLELGFNNIEFKNEKGKYISSYKSFFKLNDAFEKLFEYIKSENGQYIIEKYPKSNFYIEERFYDGKSTDNDGFPNIKDKLIFKISSKKINNLMNSNNFKDGGMVSKSKYYIILKKGLTITNESYSDELYFDTFKTGIQYSNWGITAEQYEKLKNNDTITIKGSNVSWSWKFKVTRDMVESIREIKTNNVEFDNGGEVGEFAKGGMVEFHDYKGIEIMFEPTYNEYYANDMVFYTLEDAHEYIDSGEANKTPKNIENLYRRGAMAKGGSVRYVDTNYTQNSGGVPYFLRFEDAVGSFAWKYGKYNEGILYNLSDFDKEYYSHLPLKNGEKLFRYSTDRMIDGSKYLIKINLLKGLIYFMSEQNDMNDDKNISFQTIGIKAEYITLDKDKVDNVFEKYATGGGVKNTEKYNVWSDALGKYVTIQGEQNLDKLHEELSKIEVTSFPKKVTYDQIKEKEIFIKYQANKMANGGSVEKIELKKLSADRYENSFKEEVLVIDNGINNDEFSRFSIYDEILNLYVGNTNTKQQAINKLDTYVKNNYNVVNKFAMGGSVYAIFDNIYILKVYDLNDNLVDSSKKIVARNLLEAKEIAIDDYETAMHKKYGRDLRFKIEEAPLKMEDGGDFAKGGNVSSIEKKVQEVNRLIDLANKNDISVIDSSSTWESPMKYKPIKYSNGTLYIEYQELDLYKNNRTGISEYITKKDKVLKRNMEFDNPLNDIAKMYRKALKQADIMFEDGGSVDDGNMLINKEDGTIIVGIKSKEHESSLDKSFKRPTDYDESRDAEYISRVFNSEKAFLYNFFDKYGNQYEYDELVEKNKKMVKGGGVDDIKIDNNNRYDIAILFDNTNNKYIIEKEKIINLLNKFSFVVIDATFNKTMTDKKYDLLYIKLNYSENYKEKLSLLELLKELSKLENNYESIDDVVVFTKKYRGGRPIEKKDFYESGGEVGEFAKGGGVIWDKDSDSIRTELGEFKVRITPQMQKGYYDVFVSANKKEIGKKSDVYGIDNAKDIALEIISNSNKFAKGGKVKRDTLNVLNELYDLKDDGVTEVQLNGFYESIGYVIGLELNDTEIKKVGNNAYITLYENGGSVDSADSNNLVNIDIYKLAEEMSEKDFRNKFLTLSKSEKENVESLIRLGDDKKIALITILGKREETNNDDVYKIAYHYAKGGNVDSKGRTIPQSILDYRKNYADGDENTRIRTWYMKTYPQDNRGQYIDLYNTFEDLWIAIQNNEDVYNTIVEADSLIRERLFSKLSDIKGVTYKYIYDKWLGIEDLLEESENKEYKTGGSVDDIDKKLSYKEFVETLRDNDKIDTYTGKTTTGMEMFYLPTGHSYLGKKFTHKNKQKAYKEYLSTFIMAKGGGVAENEIKVGDKVIWRGNEYFFSKISNNSVAGMIDEKYHLTSYKKNVSNAILDSLKEVKKMVDGGGVDDFSEYNFQVGDKLDLGSKGIKYFKQYDGEKIIVVDSKSDLKSSKGSYTYPSSVKKVLNKRYSTGGGVDNDEKYYIIFNEDGSYNKKDAVLYRDDLSEKDAIKIVNELNESFPSPTDENLYYVEKASDSRFNYGNINKRFLNSVTDTEQYIILENIANHYEITQNKAYAKVTDVESELLEEYITDISLRRKVYSDRRNRRYADGGSVESPSQKDMEIVFNLIYNEIKKTNIPVDMTLEKSRIYNGIKYIGDITIYTEESDYIYQKRKPTGNFEKIYSLVHSLEINSIIKNKHIIFSGEAGLGRNENMDLYDKHIKINGGLRGGWINIEKYEDGGSVDDRYEDDFKIWEILFLDKGVQKSILVKGYSSIIETNNWKKQNPNKEFIQIRLYVDKVNHYAKGGEMSFSASEQENWSKKKSFMYDLYVSHSNDLVDLKENLKKAKNRKDTNEVKRLNIKKRNLEYSINYIKDKFSNYENGGAVDEQTYIDLFEDYENIPAEVQMILDEYSESFEDGDYTGMSKAQDELKEIGYTFNFYVDGDAYGLRPIDVKLSQLKGYEDADEE